MEDKQLNCIWYYAVDNTYYQATKIQELQKNNKHLLILPTSSDIKEYVKTNHTFPSVIASYECYDEYKQVYIYQELVNQGCELNILTTQEKEFGLDIEVALSKKVGLSIYKSKLNFSNYFGAEAIKAWTQDIVLPNEKRDDKLYVKSVLFLGIAGSGKSHFIKCFAGELDRLVVKFDLNKFLDDLSSFDKCMQTLQKMKGKYVLWIDEIEKVFLSADPNIEKFKQVFLTFINDYRNDGGYYLDGIIMATANDISKIEATNPELFTLGDRWNYKLFIGYPTDESAITFFKAQFRLLEISYKDSELGYTNDDEFFRRLISAIRSMVTKEYESKQQHTLIVKDKFVYVPREIENICLHLKRKLSNNTITKDALEDVIRDIIPLQISASEGITKQLAQAVTGKAKEIK